MQLRSDLHNLSLVNKTMTQYLYDIKAKANLIATAGSPIYNGAIIYYTLNELPPLITALKPLFAPIYNH